MEALHVATLGCGEACMMQNARGVFVRWIHKCGLLQETGYIGVERSERFLTMLLDGGVYKLCRK